MLALDLKSAFDNLEHDFILDNLYESRCVVRVYDYVRTFLRDRTSTIGIGPHRSGVIQLTGRGTPQGWVTSPVLFNIAMAGLPKQLDQVEQLHHALYADDIMVWTARGSDGAIQDRPQQAVEIVSDYARRGGLSCAPQKSELVRAGPGRTHRLTHGRAGHTVSLLSRQTEQIIAMLRRVSN